LRLSAGTGEEEGIEGQSVNAPTGEGLEFDYPALSGIDKGA
jgi:hypothetical protein